MTSLRDYLSKARVELTPEQRYEARMAMRGRTSESAEDHPGGKSGSRYEVYEENCPNCGHPLHGIHRVRPNGSVDPRAVSYDDDPNEAEEIANRKSAESAYKSHKPVQHPGSRGGHPYWNGHEWIYSDVPKSRQEIMRLFGLTFHHSQGSPDAVQNHLFRWLARRGAFGSFEPGVAHTPTEEEIYLPAWHRPQKAAEIRSDAKAAWRLLLPHWVEPEKAGTESEIIKAVTVPLLMREIQFQAEGRPRKETHRAKTDSMQDPYRSFIHTHVVLKRPAGHAELDRFYRELDERLSELSDTPAFQEGYTAADEKIKNRGILTTDELRHPVDWYYGLLAGMWDRRHPGESFTQRNTLDEAAPTLRKSHIICPCCGDKDCDCAPDCEHCACNRSLKKSGVSADTKQHGVMVALYPDPKIARSLAIPGGEDPKEIHLTLGYFGSDTDLSPAQQNALKNLTHQLTNRIAGFPLEGRISGLGYFQQPDSDQEVLYASADVPGLNAVYNWLLTRCRAKGLPMSGDHGFTPHFTLTYQKKGTPRPKRATPLPEITFTPQSLVCKIGETRHTFEPGDTACPDCGWEECRCMDLADVTKSLRGYLRRI